MSFAKRVYQKIVYFDGFWQGDIVAVGFLWALLFILIIFGVV